MLAMFFRLPLPKQIPPPPGTPAIRTQARAVTILPNFVGLRFAIHNGKHYNEVTITDDMVGKKLGEFSLYVFSSLPLFLRILEASQSFSGHYSLHGLPWKSNHVNCGLFPLGQYRTRKRIPYSGPKKT